MSTGQKWKSKIKSREPNEKHLTNCMACGKKISKRAKQCPNCGEKTPSSFMRKLLYVLLVLLGLLIFWPKDGVYESANYSTNKTSSGSNKPTKNIGEITQSSFVSDPDFGVDGAIIWKARVKNISPVFQNSIKVEVTSFDKNGNILDTDIGYASSLGPAQKGSVKGFLDYYGNEEKVDIRVIK